MSTSERQRNSGTKFAQGERGFTIVEVLISLTIFSIAVAGVITVAVQGGLNVNASKLSLTATYLADEGVELMRAMRDTSVIAAGVGNESTGWSNFSAVYGATLCTAAAPCDIDPTTGSTPFPAIANVIPTCSLTGGYCPLYPGATGGYTDSSSGGVAASPYSRQIIVTPKGSGSNELQVTVNVKYMEGTIPETVTETENLFNWY